MKNKFSDFFRDDKGNFSAMRLMFIVISLIVFSVWAGISIAANQLVPIPEGILWFLCALFGVKVAQKQIENKGE